MMMKKDHRYRYQGVKCKTPGCEYNARYSGYCINCYMSYRRKLKYVSKEKKV